MIDTNNMMINLKLHGEGFVPVLPPSFKLTGFGAMNWHSMLIIENWTRDEGKYSTQEALNIIEGE